MLRKLFWVAFFMLLFLKVESQLVKPPKLIVFVVVDELDNNQLNFLQSEFSKRGFNGIAKDGHRYMSMISTDLSGYPGTRVTSLFTGMNPATHGIIGERWVDYSKNKFNLSLSPDPSTVYQAISYNHSKTLADYIKAFYGKESLSVGFALDAPWLVYSLGFLPSHFFTFNTTTGQFYDLLKTDTTRVEWLQKFNQLIPRKELLTRQWGPLKDIKSYFEYKKMHDESSDFRSFFYNLKGCNGSPYQKIAASPMGNTILRDAVVAYLANSNMGKDEVPDLLTISFTSKPFVNTSSFWLSAEKEDMLLRLDQDLASLVEFLDYEYQPENYLLVVTGASSAFEETLVAENLEAKGGVVEQNKMSALLNLYLMALHGQGKWVLGVYDYQVFLNRELINEKLLSLKEIQEKSALFVMEMAGIARAIPTYEMMLNTPQDEPFKSNFYPLRTGDIYYTLKPGWVSKHQETYGIQSDVSGNEYVPLIMKGWNIKPGVTVQKRNVKGLIPYLLEQMGLSISELDQQWDE